MRLYINIMDSTLNIVELIENKPIACLSDTYQNNLLAKIKTNFTNNEQQFITTVSGFSTRRKQQ